MLFKKNKPIAFIVSFAYMLLIFLVYLTIHQASNILDLPLLISTFGAVAVNGVPLKNIRFSVPILTLGFYIFCYNLVIAVSNEESSFFNNVAVLPDLTLILLVAYFLIEGLFYVTETRPAFINYFPIISSYYCTVFSIALLVISIMQLATALYLESHGINVYSMPVFYGSYNASPFVLKIKIFLTLIVSFILFLSATYVRDNNLNNFEFAAFMTIALIALSTAVSSLSWLLLFVSLELQALCLFVLIGWARNFVVSINTSIKYGVINFIASFFILYGVIRLILLTGDVSVSMNFISETNNYQNFIYLTPMISILIGLFIKLGVAPLAFWVPEIYGSLTLPVLIFFSTAPKFVYVFLISSLLYSYFSVVLLTSVSIKWLFLIVAVITTTVGTLGLITERKNIIRFIGWSSIANLGILFLVWGFTLHDSIGFGLGLTYIFYYIVNTLLFFGVLNYLFLVELKRPVKYFSDLQVLTRNEAIEPFKWVVIFSFLSFLGLPPLLGFWGKFVAIKGFIVYVQTSYEWCIVLYVLFMTVAGGFNYIRIYNSVVAEAGLQNPSTILKDFDNHIPIVYCIAFFVVQGVGCLLLPLILNFFSY